MLNVVPFHKTSSLVIYRGECTTNAGAHHDVVQILYNFCTVRVKSVRVISWEVSAEWHSEGSEWVSQWMTICVSQILSDFLTYDWSIWTNNGLPLVDKIELEPILPSYWQKLTIDSELSDIYVSQCSDRIWII